jgi:hypothetical protein
VTYPFAFQEHITVQIRVDGGYLVNPVFNFNLQRVEERGRKRGHMGEREDGRQEKRQRL